MMRRIIFGLMAATIMAVPALAQNRDNWREDRREFREDRRDFREDRREWRDDRRDFREDRAGFRQDRRGFYQDRQHWRPVGDNDWRWAGPRHGGPAYVGPRGYRYQPWGVGYRVPRAFAGRPYWVQNPRFFQLQPAWRGTRWVRYGPDALLIRTRDGVVVQVVRSLWR